MDTRTLMITLCHPSLVVYKPSCFRAVLALAALLVVGLLLESSHVQSRAVIPFSRRAFVMSSSTTMLTTAFSITPAAATVHAQQQPQQQQPNDTVSFITQAALLPEFTNSITASRDTNISPAEAYQVLRETIPTADGGNVNHPLRAVDVGAGAGVSTSILYQKHYTLIDAVDWSNVAWNANVVQIPSNVHFYQLDDDSFWKLHGIPHSYAMINYNFAINANKAQHVSQQYLTPDGILLAPVNDQMDYWYKQSYIVYNCQGHVVRQLPPDVGAWSVQYQPDVTSNTCVGIWCGGFNSYQQQQQ